MRRSAWILLFSIAIMSRPLSATLLADNSMVDNKPLTLDTEINGNSHNLVSPLYTRQIPSKKALFNTYIEVSGKFLPQVFGPSIDFTLGARIYDFSFVGASVGMDYLVNWHANKVYATNFFLLLNLRGYIPTSTNCYPFLDLSAGFIYSEYQNKYYDNYYGYDRYDSQSARAANIRLCAGIEYKRLTAAIGYNYISHGRGYDYHYNIPVRTDNVHMGFV